ncbi:hypothetical protein POW01_01735 [Enterobacter cloacae]|uniref:hypothetical protein n=1 Tax=Enterobacter cloacae TaxID=550 RepID=UPI002FF644EA
MSTITKEQAKDLRNAFQCWQQDYDPVEDKEQYDMFGLGMVAMDVLLASLEAEPVSVIKIDHESSLIKHVKKVVSETNAPPAPVVPAELHPDTQELVTDFCTALAEKLYKAQLKYGYDADWKQDGWPTQCQAHFHQHIAKGDPRDVAAYCAFMWYHGWKTEPAPVSVPDESAVELLATDLMKRIDKITGERHSVATLSSLRVSIVEACRAAMLQGAEPVTTDYKLPPHIYRELVNRLRDTAVKYQGCQQLREQLSRTLQEVIQPAAPQQDTSRELLVSVEGDSCGKHPDTQLINHPHRQTASIPPRPVKYCPKCEPGVFRLPDEWHCNVNAKYFIYRPSVISDKKITFVNSSFVNCSEPEGDIQFISCTLPAEWEGKVNAIDCVFKAAPQQEVKP